MKFASNRWVIGVVAAAMVGTASAGGDGWMGDFESARKLAAESGRDVLINFTGSDWNGWCVKLNEEVFSQEAFLKGAGKNFVLVELDYPRQKTLSETVKRQNELLGVKFDIRRYPTIMLCDALGVPYAYTDYQKGGPEPYLAHLDQLRSHKQKRDEGLSRAIKLQGVEKAKALIAVLDALPLHDALILGFYSPVLDAIAVADPADETGFTKKMSSKKRLREFKVRMMELGRNKDVDGAIAHVEQTLAQGGLEVDATQQIMMSRCMIHVQQKKFDEAIKVAEEALRLAPDSAMSGEIRSFQERLRKQLEVPKPAEGK